MAVNKTGLVAFVLGLAILLATWWLGFSFMPHSVYAMLSTAAVGGVIILGVFLFLTGLLLLVI